MWSCRDLQFCVNHIKRLFRIFSTGGINICHDTWVWIPRMKKKIYFHTTSLKMFDVNHIKRLRSILWKRKFSILLFGTQYSCINGSTLPLQFHPQWSFLSREWDTFAVHVIIFSYHLAKQQSGQSFFVHNGSSVVSSKMNESFFTIFNNSSYICFGCSMERLNRLSSTSLIKLYSLLLRNVIKIGRRRENHYKCFFKTRKIFQEIQHTKCLNEYYKFS